MRYKLKKSSELNFIHDFIAQFWSILYFSDLLIFLLLQFMFLWLSVRTLHALAFHKVVGSIPREHTYWKINV